MIGTVQGARGVLRYADATTALTIDGNSLVAGLGSSGSSGYLSTQLAAMPPISGAFQCTNLGISGQTIRQMNGLDGGSSSDVDGAWRAGKKNVLVVWEGTNSVYNTGRTGLQAISDLKDYCAARKAVNPWIIVALTTLPRQISGASQATVDAKNGELVIFDNALRQNFRDIGVTMVCDIRRPDSPFWVPDYTQASFSAAKAKGYWTTQDPADQMVHLNDAGYGVVAQMVAGTLRRLPVRG